ncbi:NADH-ubiquinone oxidoreductase-F iron-sulfur binding region domain-containing protein [Urbifossiella limnaea]|uniref:NADH-quinone oxidoreductase subunit F n=1 Tax=Urbifossiella limnaea TaxID=2528023 RepID=A0A517XMI6_9BACT|nr:NADH-ubiquinone oxidoreductase-F iron-sulfur binding region domain-containing protein [Urbifossiella limnaea]QDU18725.1 NADH-quinone oxidoreductase subunit F [Urbifossiella limnaea]
MRDGTRLKGVLAGGAAGTVVPPALLDVPLDFDSARHGVALGSGGMFAFDDSLPVPTLLTWLLRFFEAESCGKCTPCREGTREARAAADRLGAAATPDDAARLLWLTRQMNLTSLCGLGQSVALPVESALRHFGDEFAAGRSEGS